jgi:hypothetical protein
MALLQTQMAKALPTEPPPQIPLYLGKFKEDLDVEKAAEHLAKFLKSCVEETKLVAYSMGKTDFAQISRNDLVSVDRTLADVLGIDYAGYGPSNQRNRPANQSISAISERVDQPDTPLKKGAHSFIVSTLFFALLAFKIGDPWVVCQKLCRE